MLPFCDVGELQSKERGPGRFVLGGFPPISTLQSIVLIIIPTGPSVCLYERQISEGLTQVISYF